jgi:hypothetical protein
VRNLIRTSGVIRRNHVAGDVEQPGAAKFGYIKELAGKESLAAANDWSQATATTAIRPDGVIPF